MTWNGIARVRVLVIMAGFAVLVVGCDRTNQTESEASARAANAQTEGEAPAVAGSTVQQDQPADPPSNVPVVSVLVKETAEQELATFDRKRQLATAYGAAGPRPESQLVDRTDV